MNVKNIFFSFGVCMLLPFLTSCGDDSENDNDLSVNVASDYNGYSVANSTYFKNQIYLDQSLTVTRMGMNQVGVSYDSSSLGAFEVLNATVTESDGKYRISGSGKTSMGMGGAQPKEYECTLNALVDKSTNTSTFEFSIPAVMGGTDITLYEGALPESQFKYLIAGTYNGHTVAKAQYFPQGMTDADQSIAVSANDDNTVCIKFKSSKWGEIVIESANISMSGSVVAISGDGVATMGMEGQNAKSYACSVDGTVDVASSGKATFEFLVPSVMGGLTITFKEGEPAE